MDLQKHSNEPIAGSVRLSHSDVLWKGFHIAEYAWQPARIKNGSIKGHRLAFNLGAPICIHWNEPLHGSKSGVYTRSGFGIIPDGEPNNTAWTHPAHSAIVTIDPTDLNNQYGIDITLKQRRCMDDAVASQFAHALLAELRQENFAGKIYGDMLVLLLNTHLVNNHSTSSIKYFQKGKLSVKQLAAVIDYCDHHLDTRLSLEELSGVTHLSRYRFAHLFKNTTGLSPHQYILKRKTERAIQLLASGKHSLTQVTYMLGHTDQAHFCKSFKAITGVSPRYFMKYHIPR